MCDASFELVHEEVLCFTCEAELSMDSEPSAIPITGTRIYVCNEKCEDIAVAAGG